MTKEHLPIDYICRDFNTHLNIPGNVRTILSGKFGSGKSYFLNHFFTESTYKDNYRTITITPVDYVVAENYDVIDYIKIDILDQLLKWAEKPDDFDWRRYDDAVITGGKEIVKSLLNTVLGFKTNINSSTSISGTVKTQDVFDKIKEAVLSDAEKVELFKKEFDESSRNIFKQDEISDLIKAILLSKQDDIKTVLVIDDIDRLDPDHIFRLFNIFSSQFIYGEDNIERDQKFGFDKIVFVCDLDNIHSVFEHRYGAKADFEGYIGKFYSKTPYKFNGSKAINLISDFIESCDRYFSFDKKSTLQYLSFFFNQKTFTIRDLIKINDEVVQTLRRQNVKSWHITFLSLFIFNKKVFAKQLLELINNAQHDSSLNPVLQKLALEVCEDGRNAIKHVLNMTFYVTFREVNVFQYIEIYNSDKTKQELNNTQQLLIMTSYLLLNDK